MSLNFPILLVQKYLELNGYFVLINFHVHDVRRREPRTDVDILAIRFPKSFEKPINSLQEFKHHNLLVPTKNYIDIIIGEVKEGAVRQNDIRNLNDPVILEYALNRVGIFDQKVNREIAEKLKDCGEYVHSGVRIRKMVFCSSGFVENVEIMHFGNIIDYISQRFQKYEQSKLGVHYEDHILSLFKIAEASARGKRRQQSLCLFAYGALMSKEVLAERLNLKVDEIERRLNFRKAVLKGWRRVSNVYSDGWGGYVYNLRKDKEAETEGALICGLRHEDILRLSQYELPYTKKRLEVVSGDRKVKAYVFIYEERMNDAEGPISSDYFKVVSQAARELNINL